MHKKTKKSQSSIIRTKINPVKELAEKKGWETVDPEILLIGPKDAIEEGMRPGKELKNFYDKYDWLDVESLPNTKTEYDEIARLLRG